MNILRIDHVQIAMPAGEEDRARAFYTDVLGLAEIPKPQELADRGGAWFSEGPVSVHLGVEPDFRPARKAHPAFVVADLDTAIRTLRENGYSTPPVETVSGMRRTYVHDPFGNRIELLERIV